MKYNTASVCVDLLIAILLGAKALRIKGLSINSLKKNDKYLEQSQILFCAYKQYKSQEIRSIAPLGPLRSTFCVASLRRHNNLMK